MKGIRRAIILICTCILVLQGICSLPKGRYYNENIRKMVNENRATVIEIGREMKIDNDTIFIKRIINTEDKTYIRYSIRKNEPGWSFSESAIEVFDDKGYQYQYSGGQWSGRTWGQDGLMHIEKINEDAEFIIFKVNWYDRENEMKISLAKEGVANED